MERITILYDNEALEGFQPDWGFSALIELENETILFDTGAKEDVLRFNAERAGVSFKEVDAVFISHNHWDHTGGLGAVLEENPEVELFVPSEDCEEFEERIPEETVCVPVSSPTYIGERTMSTGIMPTGLEKPAFEHSLVVSTRMGFVLLTGCSHPGIVEIAKRARVMCGESLFLIIGGFHLYNAQHLEVERVAEELMKYTNFVAPCHCTGEEAKEVFRKLWGDRFLEVAAGVEIPLEEEVDV